MSGPMGTMVSSIPPYKKAFTTLGTKTAIVHGCMVGVKSVVNGLPIAKPWRVETTHPKLREALNAIRCDGSHEHQRCEGQDTKQTENYPSELARMILKNLAKPDDSLEVSETSDEEAQENPVLAITKGRNCLGAAR